MRRLQSLFNEGIFTNMRKRKLLEKILAEHYDVILRYCKIRLDDDLLGAEDCTQDVFLLLIKKSNELDLNQNIRGWLYASADRIMKTYLRKKAKQAELVISDLDSVAGLPATSDERPEVFDVLTDEEYELAKSYYSMKKEERKQLAEELGISLNTLYKRVHDIKLKVQNAENDQGNE